MSDQHQPLWTEQHVRNVLGDERGYVSRVDAHNLAMRIIGHYESKYQQNKAAHEQLIAERDALAAEVERLREYAKCMEKDAVECAEHMEQIAPGHNPSLELQTTVYVQAAELRQLRAEVERLRAGSYQPVPDGIEYYESRGLAYSVFNDGSAFAVGTEQGGGHFSWPDNLRLCQWQPAQDTQPGDGQEGVE